MAGVMNNTARQYNLKGKGKKGNVVVRLKPGFNVVRDGHWEDVKSLEFTKDLKKASRIDFGGKALEEKAEMPENGEKAQSKETPTAAANVAK